MTINQIRKLHGGEGIALCMPSERHKRTGFVKSWDFLGMAGDIDDVEDTIARYESDGFINVVPIAMSEDVEIREALAAKLFRVLYDQNFIARLIINSKDLNDGAD